MPPGAQRLLCRVGQARKHFALVVMIRIFQYVFVDPMDWYRDRNGTKYKSARRVRNTLGYRKDPRGDCHPSSKDGEDDMEGIVGCNVAPANEPNAPMACSDLTETGLT